MRDTNALEECVPHMAARRICVGKTARERAATPAAAGADIAAECDNGISEAKRAIVTFGRVSQNLAGGRIVRLVRRRVVTFAGEVDDVSSEVSA